LNARKAHHDVFRPIDLRKIIAGKHGNALWKVLG
jgi:hypothetical protein